MPQTSSSSTARDCTRLRRRSSVNSSSNSSAVSGDLLARRPSTRCASRSMRSAPNAIAAVARSLGRRRRAAQDRVHAQQQLAHAEGLDHVVVGAQLEADDAVDLLALGGDHDHGDRPGRGLLFRLRQTSRPDMSGSIRSRSTRSGRWLRSQLRRRRRRAPTPPRRGLLPGGCKPRTSCRSCSSSTTKTRAIAEFLARRLDRERGPAAVTLR